MRLISFALTEPQFLDGSKTDTRRMGWLHLKPQEVLCGVRKAMGLKAGEKIIRLGLICVEHVNREPLKKIDQAGVIREGFPDMTPDQFIDFFCDSHKGCTPETPITRIAFHHGNDFEGQSCGPTLWGVHPDYTSARRWIGKGPNLPQHRRFKG